MITVSRSQGLETALYALGAPPLADVQCSDAQVQDVITLSLRSSFWYASLIMIWFDYFCSHQCSSCRFQRYKDKSLIAINPLISIFHVFSQTARDAEDVQNVPKFHAAPAGALNSSAGTKRLAA